MNVYSGRAVQPLAPFLQSEFHLKHVEIGMLASFFFLGAIIFSIPMGWLVDRIGVYWILALGQLVLGSFIFFISFANSFLIICGLLLFAGMGHSTINPATGKAVMAWFSYRGRATAMGFKQTGIPIGGALAAATLPILALSMGLKRTFVVAGGVSLFSVLLCLLIYRESREKETPIVLQPLRVASLLEMFKNRNLMILSGVAIIFIFLQFTVETYVLLFCKERLLYPVITSGYLLSLTHLGGMTGRLTWGSLSDFFFGGRRKIVLIMIGGLSSVICLFFVFVSPAFPVWSVTLLVFFFGFCAIGWNGIYLTLVAELVGRERAGMATGVSLTISFSGALFGPPLFGYIVDVTGSYAYAWLVFAFIMGLAAAATHLVHEPVNHQTKSRESRPDASPCRRG